MGDKHPDPEPISLADFEQPSDEDEAEDWENDAGTSNTSNSSSSSSCGDSNSSDDSGSGSEQEDVKDYKRGGYHPLKPKDFLNNRYLIIRKLGWGHFSTVWMAFDQVDGDFKALKVVRSATTYTETARDEIALLLHAAQADATDPRRDRIVRLHDHFELDGPFGHHIVLVLEITGPSLFSVSRRAGNVGLKLQTVRNLTRRILEGLAYMHDSAQMIHTDLKPENVSLDIGYDEKLQLAKEALKFSQENRAMPKSMVSTYFYKRQQENQNPGSPMECNSAEETSSSHVADVLEQTKPDGNGMDEGDRGHLSSDVRKSEMVIRN